MKLLEFTDTHITSSSEFAAPTSDGLNEYLQSVIHSFKFVEEQIIIHQPDVLFFGGDLFDAQDYIDSLAFNVACKVWRKLSEIAIKKYAIPGNHDLYSIEHGIHSTEFLRGMGWTVVDDPDVKLICGEYVGFLPFRPSYKDEQLEAIRMVNPKVVLTHVDVIGGRRRAPKSEHDSKAFSDSGLKSELLNSCGLVLNGHYHHPSKLNSNWVNVGSLTSRSFHDKGSDTRGIVVYDTDTGELIRIPNPHAKRFIDVTIETEDDLAEVVSTDVSNCYARIYYNLDLADSVRELPSFFAGARLVPVAKRTDAAKAATAIDLRFSLDENLDRYIQEEYSDQRLRELALQILRQAADQSSAGQARQPLVFGWLEIRNFQCFKYLRINLQNQGLLLVRGINTDDPGQTDNGAGKSALIEAIYWCLKGDSLRDLTGKDVIHWDEKHCRVSLEMIVGNNVYTTVRSIKDPDYGSGVHLFSGGQSIGARLSENTEVKLDDLVARSENNLRHVCFMTSGLSHRFSGLGYAARARLLEEIIDCRPYQDALQLSKDALSKAIVERSRTQGLLDALRSRDTQLAQIIKNAEAELIAFDVTNESEVERLKTSLAEAASRKLEITANIEALGEQQQTVEKELEVLRSKRKSLDDANRILGRDLVTLKSQAAVLDSEVKRYGSLVARERCPTCEEPVNTANIKSKMDTRTSELEAIHSTLKDIQEKSNQGEKRIDQIDAALSRSMRQEKSVASSRYSELNFLKQLTESENSINRELSLFSSRRNELDTRVSVAKEELKSLGDSILQGSTNLQAARELEDRLRILVDEVFDEKGVRNSLLSQVAIPFINAKLPEYSAYLWGGRKIELSGARELKSGKCKSEIDIVLDGHYTYKSCSSGQKRRIDLSIQFALNDLAIATGSSKIGFLAVDEVLDTLDESGIYAAKEVLRQKAELGTVLMISHSKYAASITPSQLVLRRANFETVLDSINATCIEEDRGGN